MLALSFGTPVVIPITWASLLGAFAVPVLTALAVRFRGDDSKIHALVALLLSAVLAVVAMLTDDIPNDTVLSIVSGFLGVIVPAVVAYISVAQPIFKINQKLAPNKGV